MKLSDEIVLHLYAVSRATPMQYVPYNQLYLHIEQANGAAPETEFTAALRYLVGKKYIQEEAAHYRIISEGEEYAQNLLNPPIDYGKESFHEQRQSNEVQKKNYAVAIATLVVTLLLGSLGILISVFISNSQPQKPQPNISPTSPRPIINPTLIAPTGTTQDFSSLTFCYRSELNASNQCMVSRLYFTYPVVEVCMSWKPSQQYQGSSFKRVWRNNSTGESQANENTNSYGCLSWTPSLSTGQYEVELYADNVFIKKSSFLIGTASNIPIVLQISDRKGYGNNGLIIYKDIQFIDAEGDAYVVSYKLISTTLNSNVISVGNDSINMSPDEQKKGTIVEGAWECGVIYNNYSVILEGRILDRAGNQSEPFVLEFICK